MLCDRNILVVRTVKFKDALGEEEAKGMDLIE